MKLGDIRAVTQHRDRLCDSLLARASGPFPRCGGPCDPSWSQTPSTHPALSQEGAYSWVGPEPHLGGGRGGPGSDPQPLVLGEQKPPRWGRGGLLLTQATSLVWGLRGGTEERRRGGQHGAKGHNQGRARGGWRGTSPARLRRSTRHPKMLQDPSPHQCPGCWLHLGPPSPSLGVGVDKGYIGLGALLAPPTTRPWGEAEDGWASSPSQPPAPMQLPAAWLMNQALIDTRSQPGEAGRNSGGEPRGGHGLVGGHAGALASPRAPAYPGDRLCRAARAARASVSPRAGPAGPVGRGRRGDMRVRAFVPALLAFPPADTNTSSRAIKGRKGPRRTMRQGRFFP